MEFGRDLIAHKREQIHIAHRISKNEISCMQIALNKVVKSKDALIEAMKKEPLPLNIYNKATSCLLDLSAIIRKIGLFLTSSNLKENLDALTNIVNLLHQQDVDRECNIIVNSDAITSSTNPFQQVESRTTIRFLPDSPDDIMKEQYFSGNPFLNESIDSELECLMENPFESKSIAVDKNFPILSNSNDKKAKTKETITPQSYLQDGTKLSTKYAYFDAERVAKNPFLEDLVIKFSSLQCSKKVEFLHDSSEKLNKFNDEKKVEIGEETSRLPYCLNDKNAESTKIDYSAAESASFNTIPEGSGENFCKVHFLHDSEEKFRNLDEEKKETRKKEPAIPKYCLQHTSTNAGYSDEGRASIISFVQDPRGIQSRLKFPNINPLLHYHSESLRNSDEVKKDTYTSRESTKVGYSHAGRESIIPFQELRGIQSRLIYPKINQFLDKSEKSFVNKNNSEEIKKECLEKETISSKEPLAYMVNLSKYKEGSILTAWFPSDTFSKNLCFFVWDAEDSSVDELSNVALAKGLERYTQIPYRNEIFGLVCEFGMIKRARILKHKSNYIVAMLIDYGVKKIIKDDSIMYYLTDDMLKIPVQAIFCKLLRSIKGKLKERRTEEKNNLKYLRDHKNKLVQFKVEKVLDDSLKVSIYEGKNKQRKPMTKLKNMPRKPPRPLKVIH